MLKIWKKNSQAHSLASLLNIMLNCKKKTIFTAKHKWPKEGKKEKKKGTWPPNQPRHEGTTAPLTVVGSSIQGSKSKDWINSTVIKLWEEVHETQSKLKIPTVEPRIGYMKGQENQHYRGSAKVLVIQRLTEVNNITNQRITARAYLWSRTDLLWLIIGPATIKRVHTSSQNISVIRFKGHHTTRQKSTSF